MIIITPKLSIFFQIRNLFPENIVQACLQQQQSEFVTVHKRPKYVKLDNFSRINEETNLITATMAAIEMNESRNETVASPVQSAELENYEAVRPKYVDSTNVLGKQT